MDLLKSSVCVVFLVLFLMFPITAIAADAASDQTNAEPSRSHSNCGKATTEALSLARGMIAAEDAGSERNALVCLIEAVSRLEAENEKLSARIAAIEKRLPSQQQTISISNRVGDLDGAAPTVPKQHEKP